MDIKEILATGRPANEVVNDLMKKSISVPDWGTLEKEYDPLQHPVMNKSLYPDIPAKGKRKGEQMTRIVLAWQKLATKRMAELIFGIPVKRIYNPQNDAEQQVATLMEAIFKRNRINSVNLDRARGLYSSCEFVTLWYAQEQETNYAGERSLLKLRCRTFSPKKGAKLYPLFDEYDDMIALSVMYARTEGSQNTSYFETYTSTEHIRWKQAGSEWEEEMREQIQIGKIPGIYAHRDTPIWENESQNVYEAEWALSRNGNYLRKNARPNWVVFSDEKADKGKDINKDNDGVAFLQYPANAKAGYETWNQAYDALKFHIDRLEQNFNKMIQQPDISYENMKSAPMSGESRKMMFIDAQQKVTDESGIWYEALDREINVVRAFMKFMFPKLSSAIDSLQVEVEITPFQIKDETETITNLSNATGGKPIMSQRTAIQNLGYVDDVDEELQNIADESTTNLFQDPAE